jgi:LysR family glycine cleavage system transcriptional activator
MSELAANLLSGELFTDRRAIPPFASLKAFEAFGRLGGVRRAAAQLTVHHSVISRHLCTLECWLGYPLLDRSGAAPRLNETGRQYHRIISASMADIAQATRQVVTAGGTRRLLVWCAPGFATRWMSAALEEFAVLHPDMEIDLRPTDTCADFAADDADVDIRFLRDISHLGSPQGVDWFGFARPSVFPVASPGWTASDDFDGQPELFLSQSLLHEENDEEWRGWLTANGVKAGARIDGRRLYHAHMTIDAARRGQGIALANPFLVGDDLAQGLLRLVTTRAGLCPSAQIGTYVFACRTLSDKRGMILQFRDWLTAKAARYLSNEVRPADAGAQHPVVQPAWRVPDGLRLLR